LLSEGRELVCFIDLLFSSFPDYCKVMNSEFLKYSTAINYVEEEILSTCDFIFFEMQFMEMLLLENYLMYYV